MKKLTKLLTLTGILIGFATSAFADVTWTLNNVNFNRPGYGTNTATGSFTVDSAFNFVTFDITVTGTNTQANAEYTPAGPGSGPSGPITGMYFLDATDSFLAFYFHQTYPDNNPNYYQYLDLALASPLGAVGGTIDLIPGDPSNPPFESSIACPGCGTLDYTFGQPSITGVATGAGVPEPSSIVLLGSGAGLLGMALLRRKRAQVR
jgi:hypothetical protein